MPAASELPRLTREHLDVVERFYDSAPEPASTGWQYRRLLAQYYKLTIPESASILEIGCGGGELLSLLPNHDVTGIDVSANQIARARKRLPHGHFVVAAGEVLPLDRKFDYILLSETVNLAADVQRLFQCAQKVSHPGTRVVMNFYSALWRPVLEMITWLGLRGRTPPANWLSVADVQNMLELADWQVIKIQPRILFPLPVPGLHLVLNKLLAPVFSWLCLTCFCVARPRPLGKTIDHTVSVIVPARNEAGNIEAIVERMPEMGLGTEIVFVEGNSTDNTWEKIQETPARYPSRKIKVMQQSGKGKGNAVREGFAVSTGDILMILDADLTMPAEELPKFYEAVASRHGEFANGVRLVYPMESEAMQFLNLCANKTFGVIFSWLLLQSVKDTLCGTKVLFREDYENIARNRAYFGDFDPFGDFDLLFGADKLNLKIADIPIRYRERTYGETNIKRWSHGWLLLKMVLFAARKLRFT